MNQDKKGMRRNLTSYGDADFSHYLRKASLKAMGYTEDSLGRPVIGIANTFFNRSKPVKLSGIFRQDSVPDSFIIHPVQQ